MPLTTPLSKPARLTAARGAAVTAPMPVVGRLPSATALVARMRSLSIRQIVGGALLLGALIRLVLVVQSDFPLNDGALFLQMAEAVRGAHYRLPAFVTYNGTSIAFGYSPLAFYLLAALHDTLGLSLVQALRVVPLVATVAALVAFARFARDLAPRVSAGVAPSGPTVAASVLVFALVPRSYIWLLMGGGVTRSIGFLFAILAIHQAFLFYTRGRWRSAVLLGAFAGLTALSHLGTAPFVAFSVALFFVAYARRASAFVGSVAAVAISLAVSAPWWASVVLRHGWAPFVAAQATGGSVFTGPAFRQLVFERLQQLGAADLGESFFPLIAVLGLFGALASMRAGRFLLPVWWVLILLLDARAPGTYATVPVSMLAGIAIIAVVRPLLFPPGAGRDAAAIGVAPGYATRWGPPLLAAALLGYAVLGAVARRGNELNLLRAIPRDEREAMSWVRQSLPSDARVAVLTGPGHMSVWGDRVSEWFPVLAGRVSVATVQGREWINDGKFKFYEQSYQRLQACADQDANCLDQWARRTGMSYTHVYVTKEPSLGCCAPLATSLRADSAYRVVYDGPGALVLARRAPTPTTPVAPL